jgi:TRAP transporter TAXI family solute receptor
MRPFIVALGLAVALLFGGGDASAQQFVRIGSGLAGTYPVFGAKLAEMINKNIPNVRATTVPGPTEQNLVRIQKGDVEMCLTYTFQGLMVAEGKGELNVPAPDLRHVMSLYGSYHMAVVQKNSDIKSLADLKTKPYRVWVGPKASVFYPLNVAALAAYEVTPEDIAKIGGVVNTMGYQNVAQAFQDGQIDVAFFSGPAPYSLLLQLDQAPGFRILSFDEAAGNRFTGFLPGTGMATLKPGLYKSMPDAVTTPHVFNQLVVSAKMPDDLVYRITKLMNTHVNEFHGLFSGADEITAEGALRYNKLKLHPGAERYYREAGLIH